MSFRATKRKFFTPVVREFPSAQAIGTEKRQNKDISPTDCLPTHYVTQARGNQAKTPPNAPQRGINCCATGHPSQCNEALIAGQRGTYRAPFNASLHRETETTGGEWARLALTD